MRRYAQTMQQGLDRLCDLQMPEEGDMDETVREEDAADVAARKRAAAKAREEAEMRQRSQVHCSPFSTSYPEHT